MQTQDNSRIPTKQLIKLTHKWQKRLNLLQWEIIVCITPLDEFNIMFPDWDEDVQACNRFFIEGQQASIFVKATTVEPIEKLIIHELVHMVLADIDCMMEDQIGQNDSRQLTYTRYLEKTVQSLTQTLYSMETNYHEQ